MPRSAKIAQPGGVRKISCKFACTFRMDPGTLSQGELHTRAGIYLAQRALCRRRPMVHSTASRLLVALALLAFALPVSARQELKKPAPEKLTADEKKAAAEGKKANEEAAKKSVDEFEKKIKECKTIPEKALAIINFGETEPKDKCMVPP